MMQRQVLCAMFALSLACLPVSAQNSLPPAATIKIDYDEHVRPLLMQHCYSCHGPEVQQSGLRLDLRQNALRGGDYGPVMVPGKSEESKLIHRLVSGDGGIQMPPTGALSDEEIGILRAWIDQGPQFRTEVAEAATPRVLDTRVAAVIAAARAADRAVLEKLLSADSGLVNAKDLGGSTPLHHAAGFGSVDVMKLLIEKGADINAKNLRESTPLHWAIHDETKVRLLLAGGADLNAKQVENRTPVHQASLLTSGAAVVRLLLERGANAGQATIAGQTPLMAAAARGDVDVMRMLIGKGADVNARNGAGDTALMLAANTGNVSAVRLLLESGADALAKSKRHETALGNASTAGVPEIVKLLLDRGADVNHRNMRGYSPLMLAAASDAIPADVVKMLLTKGADRSFVGDYDETAQILASKRGDTTVTALLGLARPPAAAPEMRAAARMESTASAVEKAIALLEKQSFNFIRVGGCNSCHSQDLPSAALGFARDKGVTVPKEIPQLPSSMTAPPERIMDFNLIGVGSLAWELFDIGMNHGAKSQFTDAVVRYIRAMQSPEGQWSANEGRRPPMNAGDFQTTALAIYALKHFAPETDRAGANAAISRAVAWLQTTRPGVSQDRAFHLLGLVWGGGSADSIRKAVQDLATTQQADGGWNQLPSMPSDAYATGQALYALNAAGRSVTDPVYQKGAAYLLQTQAPDGSWHVQTRAIWFQPYFESGFPYGRDQFISTAGTAWAAMALAPVAEHQRTSERRNPGR